MVWARVIIEFVPKMRQACSTLVRMGRYCVPQGAFSGDLRRQADHGFGIFGIDSLLRHETTDDSECLRRSERCDHQDPRERTSNVLRRRIGMEVQGAAL